MRRAESTDRSTKGTRDADGIRVKQLLAWAVRNPSILKNERCREADFCAALLERCVDLAATEKPEAVRLAQGAVALAEEVGDPHLVNRSRDVLAQAHMAFYELTEADELLLASHDQAFGCCRACRVSRSRTGGELLHRAGQPWLAFYCLTNALGQLGEVASDGAARILHQLAATSYKLGHPEVGLNYESVVFETLSLDSPRGLFLQALTVFSACQQACDPSRDKLALRYLACLRKRIRGRDWPAVLARLRHVRALIHDRMGGGQRRVRKALEGSWESLLKCGTAAEVLGATITVVRRRVRPPRRRRRWNGPSEDNRRQARRVVERCRKERPDLRDDEHRKLEEMLEVLDSCPEEAFDRLGALSESFEAPVPGLRGEGFPPPPEPVEPPPFVKEQMRQATEAWERFREEAEQRGLYLRKDPATGEWTSEWNPPAPAP